MRTLNLAHQWKLLRYPVKLFILRASNPWAQEVPGSNPGAPTTNSLKQLRFSLRCISTSVELGNIWEQLTFEQVHSMPLRTDTGMRVDFQRCCHVRVPELRLCDLQRRSL